ncbi:MAG: polyketide cyclase [Marmoricola sp.]|nr:polyketide cyclase [Marmoricola sp.]
MTQIDHQSLNTVVHAAFRRTLDRFDVALASFPAGSQQRADELARAWDFFAHEVHDHHHYEEEFFWPALGQTDADLASVAELDSEHDAMRTALDKATDAMGRLHADPSGDSATAARTALATLSSVLLGHLEHEERDLEPISVSYADTKPMKAALAQVKKAHLTKMGNFVEWLQDGATEADKAGLRREIPAPVVFLFATIAGRHYRKDIAPVWR